VLLGFARDHAEANLWWRKAHCGRLVAMMFHQEDIKTIHAHCKQDDSPELDDALSTRTLRGWKLSYETASLSRNTNVAARFPKVLRPSARNTIHRRTSHHIHLVPDILRAGKVKGKSWLKQERGHAHHRKHRDTSHREHGNGSLSSNTLLEKKDNTASLERKKT
jgi:hypothetical protein